MVKMRQDLAKKGLLIPDFREGVDEYYSAKDLVGSRIVENPDSAELIVELANGKIVHLYDIDVTY